MARTGGTKGRLGFGGVAFPLLASTPLIITITITIVLSNNFNFRRALKYGFIPGPLDQDAFAPTLSF